MPVIGIVVVVAAVAVLAIVLVITKLMYICPPSSVLVFSGGRRQVGERVVGFRLIQGGRGIRIPLLEAVDVMDLTNMSVDLQVSNAYSKGGIPLNVHAVANVKISSTETVLNNAIERFLGRPRETIMQVARETLEGNLRGVLAMLTPEEVNQDRVKFAHSLLAEAGIDFRRLGLDLDTLNIQSITDDKGYLDSLGRKQSAELIMRSRIAEAENQASTAERAAANYQEQEIAKIENEILNARAEANRRIVDARTRKDALIAEERSTVQAAVAKAMASVEVQKARLEQVRLQLQADEIKPAVAARQQAIEAARGQSAIIVEEGKATAGALTALSATWAAAGDNARQILVAQRLSGLVGHLMSTVGERPIDKVTFIDRDLSRGGNLAIDAAITSEQLKHTLGIDIPALINRAVGGRNGGGAPQNGQ